MTENGHSSALALSMISGAATGNCIDKVATINTRIVCTRIVIEIRDRECSQVHYARSMYAEWHCVTRTHSRPPDSPQANLIHHCPV
jgi:hypothetical protein